MKPTAPEPLPRTLVSAICAAAQVHFELERQPDATRIVYIPKLYSRVFRVDLTADRWRGAVYAKLPSTKVRDIPAIRATFRKEFEILSALTVRQGINAETGCVTPLMMDDTTPALVTVAADGVPLATAISHNARLLSAAQSRSMLVRRAAQCGAWLRQFHDHTASGNATFDAGALIDYCRLRLEPSVSRQVIGLDLDTIARALHVASIWAKSVAGSEFRHSGRHNDFSCHNIIATESGGIRVLDFTMYDQGPNSFDVCSLWFELEMLKSDRTYSQRLLCDMQHAFLDQYGSIRPSDPDFQLARLRYSVVRLTRLNSLATYRRWLSPSALISRRRIMSWIRDASRDPLAPSD